MGKAGISRAEFDAASRKMNSDRACAVAEARVTGAPCRVVDMLAFGGVPYCSAHRVMGPCPYGAAPKGGAS